jgi:sugar phosphate isomerase/epimerase
MSDPLMIATCWTSAGNVKPLDADERSPFDIVSRVRSVAATGWRRTGIAQDDVRQIRDTIGFGALRKHIEKVGLVHAEVEFLTDWWESGPRRTKSDEIRESLFDAAVALQASHIKVGTAFSGPLTSVDPLVEPLRQLSEETAGRGIRIAIGPMPFSMLATIPMAAELVRRVDNAACGIMVDSWHVFRAGTTLDELKTCLTPDIVVGVELDDADADVVGTLFEDTTNNRRLCGRGSFDLAGLVRTLTSLGYTGGWASRSSRKNPGRCPSTRPSSGPSAPDAGPSSTHSRRLCIDEFSLDL